MTTAPLGMSKLAASSSLAARRLTFVPDDPLHGSRTSPLPKTFPMLRQTAVRCLDREDKLFTGSIVV